MKCCADDGATRTMETARHAFHGPGAEPTGPGHLWDAQNAENSRKPPVPCPNPRLGQDKPVVQALFHWAHWAHGPS